MEIKEILKDIWDLKHVKKPAFTIEESLKQNNENINCCTVADNLFESEFQKSLQHYLSLRKDRDDNTAALHTALGTYVIPGAFCVKIREFPDGRKYVESPVIYDASDVDRIRVLPIMESILGQQINLVQFFVDRSEGRYPVRMPDIQNPLGVAGILWETNNFYTSLIEHPQAVHKLLDMITEVIIEYISRVKMACPDIVPISWPQVWAPADKGVFLADDTMSMVSPEMYEEYGVPYNNRISRKFGGIMLHSCTIKKQYFESIMKNEGLRSINFAAQYSSDMKDIFNFFGGKVVVIPQYVHTDNPQIGTLPEFVGKVMDCWSSEAPTIVYVSPLPEGGLQEEVFDTFKNRGFVF